jgi:DNA polymerase-1
VYQYPEFNPNSSKQKIHVLEQMGFTIPKMRNNKGIFTSSSSLTSLLKLQLKTPAAFLADLINYATLNKLKTNYSEDALKLDEDGRFRFSYGVTETGRLKCSSTPWDTGRNSQNFPREKQFNFKSAFVADPGHILINTDLSAAEARVLAYITQDPALVRIFSDNLDYHQYVADQLSEMRGQLYTRQLAKRINHASAYGMGGYKFAEIALIEEGITITPEEAQILLDSRNVIFKGVEQWRVGIRKTLTDPDPTNWYLVNPYGRVRYFFGPRNRKENGDWSGQTQKIFRDAYAHEPQSTSSDYLKLAWCDFAERAPWAQVLQECHDSLLIQCRKEDETRTIDALNISMKQDLIVAGKCYHIPHDLKVGYSWGDF